MTKSTVCFVWFDSLRPINNLSVIKGRVFLGWTSTKLGLMFLLKDTTQWCRWGSNPRPFGLESSTLPLSHCAPCTRNQQALPLVPGWILVPSDPWRWQEKLLCSVVWHYHRSYVQHYMANLMLVQCVIAIHEEVWTCQFWWKFYQELTVTMVQVPEGMAVSTQG